MPDEELGAIKLVWYRPNTHKNPSPRLRLTVMVRTGSWLGIYAPAENPAKTFLFFSDEPRPLKLDDLRRKVCPILNRQGISPENFPGNWR
jgi:hypothetical protein